MEVLGTYDGGIPIVPVVIAGKSFAAIMDTGFDGFAILPARKIADLRLPEMGKAVFRTADGRMNDAPVYEGLVELCGGRASVEIDSTEGDFVLVGMRLLYSMSITMRPSRGLLLLSRP